MSGWEWVEEGLGEKIGYNICGNRGNLTADFFICLIHSLQSVQEFLRGEDVSGACNTTEEKEEEEERIKRDKYTMIGIIDLRKIQKHSSCAYVS